MRIQAKVLISLVIVFGILVSSFFAWSKLALEKDFAHLEQHELEQNIERLHNTYLGEIDNLNGNIVDYAKWDASEVYIGNLDPAYIKENYGDETPMGLGVNLIAITKNGKFVFGVENDSLTPKVKPLSDSTKKLFESMGIVSTHGKNIHETELVPYKNRVLIVTYMTIQKADESGSKQGLMIFGRYLDENIRKTIEDKTKNSTHMSFDIQLKNTLKKSPNLAQLSEEQSFSQAINDSTYEFKKIYRDYKSEPVVLFDVSFKRQTMQTGKQTIFNMLLGILILGAILLVATLITTHRVALKKLTKLTKSVHDISENAQKGSRVPQDQGQDEICFLQNEINGMLSNIDDQNIVIEKKNKSMANMLSHMEQGLLVIQADGTIHPEYSDFTKTIFAQENLAGLPWQELFFKDCLLDSDRKSQMEASLFSVLGEDLFNWELNSDSIWTELSYTRNGVKQYLELGYTPLLDDSEIVENLLVSIRDVTLIKQLTEQAEIKQQELALLEKLLELSPTDMDRFVKESFKRLEKAEEICKLGAIDQNQINALFRELHTLKGNSRTCGFRELSSFVHEAEEPVQKMRNIGYQSDLLALCVEQLTLVKKGIEDIQKLYHERFKKFLGSSISATMLLLPKDDVQRLLNEYQNINLHDEGNAENFLKDLQKTIEERAIDTQKDWTSVQANADQITTDGVAHFMQTMAQSSFSPMSDVLQKIHKGLEPIAQALEIPHPELHVPEIDFLVRNEYLSAMEAVSGHILRNSYDHGIEKPAVRTERGKSEKGHIRVEFGLTYPEGGEFERPCIWIGDDGNGLNLNKIREKALASNLISENATPHEIAMAIFKPGFSSRDEVSEISGRGVGMDVVVQEMKAIGGGVDLELAPANEFGNIPFRICISLPRLSSLIFMPE